MSQRYYSRVIVSEHARNDFAKRYGEGRLSSHRVMGCLSNVLALGANVTAFRQREDVTASVVVQVPVGGLIALVTPMAGAEGGGWLCFCVLGKQMRVG
jgi:hypothetical protein